ncbi:MAG: PilZ domain-containing protein [Desulfobacteraceae bacterium]|jgi:c-di-GMP-binding flagellar brake protein YcgR
MIEKGKTPDPGEEKRQYPRIETNNFVSYVCVDEEGNEIAEGYGTTRDLSQGGVKLETREPLESPYVMLLAIDLNEQLLEIRGNVVYTEEVEKGRFFIGIRFVDTEDKQREVVLNFVKSHVYLRNRDEEID